LLLVLVLLELVLLLLPVVLLVLVLLILKFVNMVIDEGLHSSQCPNAVWRG
jgi:hypothetical protein